MRDFHNPNAHLKFRVPPYTKMKGEERAYVIQNLYRQGYLKDQDVLSYLRLGVLDTFVWLGGLAIISTVSYERAKILYKSLAVPKMNAAIVRGLWTFGVAWTIFSYVNPIERRYIKEQTKVMDWIDVNLGDYVFDYNAMLPRRWTQAQINLTTYFLLLRRKWFSVGFLAAPPATPDLILDMSDAKVPE